jgi:hypothetical protein
VDYIGLGQRHCCELPQKDTSAWPLSLLTTAQCFNTQESEAVHCPCV